MHEKQTKHPYLVFYDGSCIFCNAVVNFIIRHDRKAKIRFVAIQSKKGQDLLQYLPEKYTHIDSILFKEQNIFHIKSTAAFRIAWNMGGIWKVFIVFLIIPARIRNVFYNIIARNRYKWFGKYNNCLVPDDSIRERFVS